MPIRPNLAPLNRYDVLEAQFWEIPEISRVVTMATNNEHIRMRGSHDCGQEANADAIYSFWRQHFGAWSSSGTVAVATEGANVVGTAVGLPWSSNIFPGMTDFRGELHLLAVSPERESRSIGTGLVCFVAARLAEKDLLPMMVWSWMGSERARRLYQARLGATQLATRMDRCYPGLARFAQVGYGWA